MIWGCLNIGMPPNAKFNVEKSWNQDKPLDLVRDLFITREMDFIDYTGLIVFQALHVSMLWIATGLEHRMSIIVTGTMIFPAWNGKWTRVLALSPIDRCKLSLLKLPKIYANKNMSQMVRDASPKITASSRILADFHIKSHLKRHMP